MLKFTAELLVHASTEGVSAKAVLMAANATQYFTISTWPFEPKNEHHLYDVEWNVTIEISWRFAGREHYAPLGIPVLEAGRVQLSSEAECLTLRGDVPSWFGESKEPWLNSRTY